MKRKVLFQWQLTKGQPTLATVLEIDFPVDGTSQTLGYIQNMLHRDFYSRIETEEPMDARLIIMLGWSTYES